MFYLFLEVPFFHTEKFFWGENCSVNEKTPTFANRNNDIKC